MIEFQPYVDTVVQSLIGLLVIMVLSFITMITGKAKKWLESRTTADQRATLHRIAQEGAALAESKFRQHGGPQKLAQALEYSSKRLADVGIDMPSESIRAAIEKAVIEYRAGLQAADVQEDDQQ